jgi:hypothetical protein
MEEDRQPNAFEPGEQWRPDFEQAMGETFGWYVRPQAPFDEASPHNCCEAVWSVLGAEVTPAGLAAATPEQVAAIARAFARLGDGEAPPVERIRQAIADTLARWPWGRSASRPIQTPHLTGGARRLFRIRSSLSPAGR